MHQLTIPSLIDCFVLGLIVSRRVYCTVAVYAWGSSARTYGIPPRVHPRLADSFVSHSGIEPVKCHSTKSIRPVRSFLFFQIVVHTMCARLADCAKAFLRRPRLIGVSAELCIARHLAQAALKSPSTTKTQAEPYSLRAARLLAFKVLDTYESTNTLINRMMTF